MDQESQIQVFGAMWCVDCRRSKRFLEEHGIPFKWHDVSVDAVAMALVQKVNGGMKSIPTILFLDGSVLVEPSDRELAKKLGVTV
ncbi:MAG: NrdH-redoxin [Dehalococcoidia bacterium]|nr:NrdH-redoxin [Dehalococcoidia bacterium]